MDLARPNLTEIGESVLAKRYLVKNEKGEVIESPQQRFERVARHVAQNDPDVWPVYYKLMAQRDFVPNSPCLINAGRPHSLGQLSACYVLRVEDSIASIMDALKDAAIVHKAGGGIGASFSRIRPAGDFVCSTTGIASGPVSFMFAFDAVTETIKQSGIRRGANLGALRVDHPDILKFIDCKIDTSKLQNFNVSVLVTNAFMAAVEAGTSYDLINPRTSEPMGSLDARSVWDRIAQRAHATGEPGLFFVDRVNELDPLSKALGPIEAPNACAELGLRPYDACCLGSVNLGNFFEYRDKPTIDFERLETVVKTGVRFLDDILEVNQYPVEEMYRVTRESRKVGLGVMGWADLLIKLGIPYTSDQALGLAEQTMQFINAKAVEASEALATERGPFPAFSQSRWAEEGHKPRRNATNTTIAPTGTISIIAGCSSSIEPLFALCMTRKQADMTMVDVNSLFIEVARREGFYSEALLERVRDTGSVKDDSAVPERWQVVFRTANEIDAEHHVRMQAAFQRHVHDAISKTANAPRDATVEDVQRLYELAWKEGCKGITVYRDGCREGQVLTAGAKKKEMVAAGPELHPIPEEPHDSKSHDILTPAGKLHLELGLDHGRPFEAWFTSSRAGTTVHADVEALSRLSSLILRMDSPIDPVRRMELIADQLSGLGGGDSVGLGRNRVLSVPDGAAKALRRLADALEARSAGEQGGSIVGPPASSPPVSKPQNGSNGGKQKRAFTGVDICPECHQVTLHHAEGCVLCANTSCGYSRC